MSKNFLPPKKNRKGFGKSDVPSDESNQLNGIPKRFQFIMKRMSDLENNGKRSSTRAKKGGESSPENENDKKAAEARKRKPGESMVDYERRITAICNEAINGAKGIRAKRKEHLKQRKEKQKKRLQDRKQSFQDDLSEREQTREKIPFGQVAQEPPTKLPLKIKSSNKNGNGNDSKVKSLDKTTVKTMVKTSDLTSEMSLERLKAIEAYRRMKMTKNPNN